MKLKNYHNTKSAGIFLTLFLLSVLSCTKQNGEVFNGLFLNGELPEADNPRIIEVTIDSAKVEGNIISSGNCFVSERGICWSTSANPTISDNLTRNGSGTGTFTASILNLKVNTSYFIRIYATNKAGTQYSGQTVLTTNGFPTVTTPKITSVNSNTAVISAMVSSAGGLSITRRGLCWSKLQNPTISDNHIDDEPGPGLFTLTVNNLEKSSVYYVKAYAANSMGTTYSENTMFVTIGIPIVTTSPITSITSNSAISGGNVISDEGSEIISRGVCRGTSANPEYTPNIYVATYHTTDGTGIGDFCSIFNNLSPGTTYYLRAYAINKAGIGYGNQIVFRTHGVPQIKTTAITSISTTSAIGGGEIITSGGSPVTEGGICWSISQNPSTSDYITKDDIGPGAFVSVMNQLWSGTTYYVRAYATNSYGTGYGDQVSFTALTGLPTVVTTEPVEFTESYVTCGGNVVSSGMDAGLISRGLCWSTSRNPTIDDLHNSETFKSGAFSLKITGLLNKTRYFVRAYATTLAGTSYGNEITFQTWGNIGSLTDIDGNTYKTIEIGSQVWMQEDLKVNHYRNGDEIPTGNSDWGNLTSGAHRSQKYNYYAVIDPRNICPSGWHPPTKEEYERLKTYLGGGNNTGGKMKDISHWESPNGGATNESGFSAWASSDINRTGQNMISTLCSWWTSSEYSNETSFGIGLNKYDGSLSIGNDYKVEGSSVRCIKDKN